MSEQNKDISYSYNLLQQFKDQKNKLSKTHQQDQELDLSLGLSLGGSYTRPSSGSRNQPQPETGFIVRKFSLKNKSYSIRYGCGENNSGRHQPARAVPPLHPDVDAELNKSKETKAMTRYEAKNRSKRPLERERKLEEEREEEGWQRSKNGKFGGKSGNWVVGSTTKDTAYFRAMEKPKYTNALDQSSNAAWAANSYRPEPNQRVSEIGTSTHNVYANTYASRNPYEVPMMRGRENVHDSSKTTKM